MYEGACIARVFFKLRFRQASFDAKSGFARLFLQVVEFLLRGIQRLLLGVDLFLIFAGMFGELCLVAQHCAGIAIVGRGVQACFTLGHIQFTLQGGDFFFLQFNLFFQLVRFIFWCVGWLGGILGFSFLGIGVSFLCGLRRTGSSRRGAARQGVVIQLNDVGTRVFSGFVSAGSVTQRLLGHGGSGKH